MCSGNTRAEGVDGPILSLDASTAALRLGNIMAAVPRRSLETGVVEGAGSFEKLPLDGGDAVFLLPEEASRREGDTISWYGAGRRLLM